MNTIIGSVELDASGILVSSAVKACAIITNMLDDI